MTVRNAARVLSTADERRDTVLRTAVRAFAARGYYGTPTVDIAKEFTNLIVLQRGYQANSRVITTVDELSQETINLKR